MLKEKCIGEMCYKQIKDRAINQSRKENKEEEEF
jgi:hypothetical protein